MERAYIYEIEIELNNADNATIFNGQVEYYSSNSYKDDLLIALNKIEIIAKRSSKIELSNIFDNYKSSLYNQIIKALAYYYGITGNCSEINSIKVTRRRGAKLETNVLNKQDINQLINPTFTLNYNLNPNKLEVIFTESEKGKMILNALSYLLKACCTVDNADKFERLWKSFNPLYRLIGKKPEEFECLIETKLFISNNYNIFHYTNPTTKNLNAKKLRQPLRWREMIINNHPKGAKIKSYRDSVLRYSDSRVMNVYLETIGNVEPYLKNAGYYNDVINHINQNIANNAKDDSEIISILMLKYMYFVRNKSFHGEKLDSTFRLTTNKEIKEFAWLNIRIEPFIFDLINSNEKY